MKIEPVDCRSNGQFTEIASPKDLPIPTSVIAEYTRIPSGRNNRVKLTNEYSSIFIYSLDQKNSFQCNRCHGKIVKYLLGIRVVNIFILQLKLKRQCKKRGTKDTDNFRHGIKVYKQLK
jgi:hypothetical protein